MKTLDEIKRLLIELKPQLIEKYKINEIGIFGSYIREEHNSASDLDILVEFDETPSLLKFIEFENYLSDTLGIKVDLVMKRALKPYIGEVILNEVIYI